VRTMYETLNNLFPLFGLIWAGGTLLLYFTCYASHAAAYLRRFPPIDQYQTLDMYTSGAGNPPGTGRRYYAAIWLPQDDPELERLRIALA